jgi:ribose transport system substrate-binding protein
MTMLHRRAYLVSGGLTALLALSGPLHAELKPSTGPNGEPLTLAKSLTLTPEQEAKIKVGKFTVAIVWHESSDWSKAVIQGASDEFSRLGIEVVAQTDANFDAAKQKSDVETVMAKKPSAIFSELVDPDTAAEAFRPARDAGEALVFVDQPPKDFKAGKDYVSVVSDDFAQMGKHAGDAMAAALGGKGKIAYVYHDANFFVTNQRDSAFKQTILEDHKGVQIVAEQGLADPTRAEDVLNALVTKHPDLDGIYATWSTPAESVLAALRNAGNMHTKIVTFDLSEPLAVDMVKGGNVAGIVVDQAYLIGQTGAKALGLGLIGEKAAPYYAVDALTVTRPTIRQGYQDSLHRDLPASLAGK